ncbi:MAG TPA: YfhO family protein [Thermoanaerobaculia bacterium]|nr:YfhO family protein [Thermoanaerobaculia bacterium]
MSLLVFLLGGGLIAALVRWWRPDPPWPWVAAYLVAAGAFFALPLATPAVGVPADIVYQWRPWSEVAPLAGRPQNELLSDVPLQFLPFHALVRERLLAGAAPLWAHELGTGQPLAGNGQSAPWAPLHLLALPLAPLRALTVSAALQTLLALLLMHALLAALGAGRAGSTFGALAFAFSAYMVCWAYHPLGVAAAWVPGVLLGLVALRRGERGALAGLAACGCGLAASGHPETMAFAALAAVAVTLALLAPCPGPPATRLASRGVATSVDAEPGAGGPGRGRFVLLLAVAAALTASLSAPVLLPVLAAIPESARAAVVAADPTAVEPPPFTCAALPPLVSPLVYGSPRDGNWSGPHNFNELSSGYAGLLALALALAAAVALRGRWLAILAAGGAALAAALRLPPFVELADALPGLAAAAHGRMRLLWVLALAVAGGLGLDELARRRSGRRAAAVSIAAAALALALSPPPPEPWQRAWWVATLAGAALVGVSFLSPLARLRDLAPWLAVAALVLDLALLNGRYLPVLPPRFDLSPPPAAAWLMARTREAGAPFRVLAEGFDLMPNLGSYYGLWDPRSDDPMQPAAAALIVGRGLAPRFELGRLVLLAPNLYPQPLLDYLGVRFLLERHRHALPPPWRPVWDGPGGRIWSNPRALPLFFFPARAVAVPAASPDDVLAIPDFAATALVDSGAGAGRQTQGKAGEGAAPARGQVRVERVTPNSFELALDTPTGGLVVSSVSYARGWNLALDGQPPAASPSSLVRVNAAFLGFRVPPGSHRAVLAYRPDGWIWGLRLFTLGCAAAVGGILACYSSRILSRVGGRFQPSSPGHPRPRKRGGRCHRA